jgi:ribonuclease HII
MASVLGVAQQRALQLIAEYPLPYLIGIDEVGVGSWAGPVVVAGCVVTAGWRDAAVKDSKQLTQKRRQVARDIILRSALASVVLEASSDIIDQYGIGKVHAWLTEGVALYCLRRFPDALVIQDGELPIPVGGGPPMVWLAKADVHVPAVSAASVLAKEHRDKYMREQHALYPAYGFNTNMGYGTPQHHKGLQQVGTCPLHRISYKPVQQAATEYRARLCLAC